MRLTRFFAGVLLLAAGCSDAPTAVPIDDTLPPSGISTTEWPPLKEWEQSEKDRVEQEKDSSQAVYDSLKIEWTSLGEQYLDGNPLLLYCEPLQYAAEVKVIGPAGGDLSIGPHKLHIPKGALQETVVITGEMPVSLAVSVRLSPHGLRFAQPPLLTLSYDHCNRPSIFSERVAYVDELFNVLEWPTSQDDVKYARVHAYIDHFSRYAVAY
jgi:hypothetical protein